MAEDSRIVWHGRSWRLRVEQWPLGDGRFLERGYIEHPGSVALLPLRPGSQGWEVLMLRQYRLALRQTILEIPAGTRGWDEDWLACAQRELREETGYRAGQLVELGDIWPAPGVTNEKMRLYLALDLEPDPLPADVDEELALIPMPLAELLTLAQTGQLHDAKTLIALFRLPGGYSEAA